MNINRVAHGIDDADEFYQHTIASGLNDAAAVLDDFWIDQFLPVRLELAQRTFLVGTHQPAIAGDVARNDCSQPSFDALLGHKDRPGPNMVAISAYGEEWEVSIDQYCPLRVISDRAIQHLRRPMSALLQKRTNHCDAAIVRFVPIADIKHANVMEVSWLKTIICVPASAPLSRCMGTCSNSYRRWAMSTSWLRRPKYIHASLSIRRGSRTPRGVPQ